jgi:hypothetical protein
MPPFQDYLKPGHLLAASTFRTLVSRMEVVSARLTREKVCNDFEELVGAVTAMGGFASPAAAGKAYATLRLAHSGRFLPMPGEDCQQMLLRMLGARNEIEARWARSQAAAAKVARGPRSAPDAAFAPQYYGAGAAPFDGTAPPYTFGGSAAAFGGSAFPADEPR